MKKRISILLVLAILALGLVGCGQEKTDKIPGRLKEITLVLDWTPNTNHTGIFVARDKGFFEEAGIELSIVQPPEDGAEALTAIGKADFGISFQDTIAAAWSKEDPLPVTAVATIIQHNTSGIVSLKGNGIESPRGMENKTYATWEMPIEQKIIETVMERDGGDFSKLRLIPSTVTDVITALKTDIDAIWIYYGWDGIALETKGVEADYFAFKDIDETFDYYTPIIIGNNDFLAENPELTKDFLAALEKGYRYAIEKPEEAADILLESSPELDRDIVVNSQKYLAKEYMAELDRWGYIDSDRWNNFYSWLYENKLIDLKIEEDFGFTNEFLPE